VRLTCSEIYLRFRNANRESVRWINSIALIGEMVSVHRIVTIDKTVQVMYNFISELSIFTQELSARAPYAPLGNYSHMHPEV
jgi:hypothetical protein